MMSFAGAIFGDGQIYIFINDADDRVVECILISGLWS